MKAVTRAVKIFWIFLWAGIMTLLLFFPMVVSSLLSRTGNLAFSISKIWARVMLLVSATRVRAAGKEKIKKSRSYVIIANHQSQFDILAIVTSLGVQFRWIIKQEILKVPLFGYALYASRNIFIDRRDPERARASIRKGLDRLPRGVSVMFFAEGTRSPNGRLLPFKKGGFAVALERNYPVLPVTVNGSRHVLPRGSVEFHPGRIEVVIGDPIDTAGYASDRIGELMERTRHVIESNLDLGPR
ncbi:MAG: 1-acyl-sn-glycerol-3-phosphate acyltransferase [Spirochaetes bacterium]|nr:1-acyl-sn-glycerol-3-phosphate acyltransferase [Spirochaetota bacterium]